MEMETVKLSSIASKFSPELIPFLKQKELNSMIVLRDGIQILEREDAVEIIQHSICEHQKDTCLH